MRVIAALWLVGCGYADRQREICHPETGCRPRPFWPDADGDGWGRLDPTQDLSVVAVDPPDGFVGNARDCDDDDPGITGDVEGLCPRAFAPGAVARGEVGGEREAVVLITADLNPDLTDPCQFPLNRIQAEHVCGTPGWGGALGAGPDLVRFAQGPVWVATSLDALDARWAEVAGRDELGPGAVLWDANRLRNATDDECALVACERPTPDPSDYETPARER